MMKHCRVSQIIGCLTLRQVILSHIKVVTIVMNFIDAQNFFEGSVAFYGPGKELSRRGVRDPIVLKVVEKWYASKVEETLGIYQETSTK